MNVWYINSILGAICLEEENDALCGVHFCPDGAPELEPLPRRVVETPLLQEAEEQLNEYFSGVRREFDLPLAAKGTAFQQAVWAQLRKIPYGEVRTYGQLAAALGKPKASRAVGSACHRNPLCIVVPCHRVIASDGSCAPSWPAGHRRRRQPDRLRRGTGDQGISTGTGTILRE